MSKRFRACVPVCGVGLGLLLGVFAGPARAGQVRFDVGPGGSMTFSPSSRTLNFGDQVVWVWMSSGHSVTSGSGCTSSGIFGTATLPSTARFAWKSDLTGSVPFFCLPHCPDMAGTLTIPVASVLVSDFRITEVYLGSATDSQFVEIQNKGGAAGDLGAYRLSVATGTALNFPLVTVPVAIGGRVVLHLNQSGSQTASDLFFPGVRLARTGSAALYVPNTVAPSLADDKMMVDFVQWGAAGGPNESTADVAGYWTTADFVSTPATGRTMEYCGNETEHGVSFWKGIAAPTPGGSDCATPTLASTWGRVKTLYR